MLTLLLGVSCTRARSAAATSAKELTQQGIKQSNAAETDADVDKAVDLFRQALAADRTFVPAHYWLGCTLIDSESWQYRVPQAKQEFETVFDLDKLGRESHWVRNALQWLCRLEGHPKTFLLVPIAGGGMVHQDAASKVVQAMVRSPREGCSATAWATEGGARPSDERIYDACARSKVEQRRIGWAASVEVVEYQEPQWQQGDTSKSKSGLGGLLSSLGKADAGYKCSLTARAQLLDPAFERVVATWTVSGTALAKEARAAEDAAARQCAQGIWDRAVGLADAEDKIIEEQCGMLSLATNEPSIYAWAGTKDRAKTKAMPMLLLLPAKDWTQGRLSPEAQAPMEASLRKVSPVLFSTLAASQKVAVVPPSEMAKRSDLVPDGWAPSDAATFARRLGDRCSWVLIPRVAKFEAFTRQRVVQKMGVGRVTLECVVVDARSGEVVATVSEYAESTNGETWLSADPLEEQRILAAQGAIEKAVQKLAPQVLAKTAGGK